MIHIYDAARQHQIDYQREAANERIANKAVQRDRVSAVARIRKWAKHIVEVIANAAQRRVY